MTIKVRLLFFGKARELVNQSETEIQLLTCSLICKQLEEEIFEKLFPQLLPISKNCIIAVNQRYCQEPDELLHLNEQSEIAIIPPLSGG